MMDARSANKRNADESNDGGGGQGSAFGIDQTLAGSWSLQWPWYVTLVQLVRKYWNPAARVQILT